MKLPSLQFGMFMAALGLMATSPGRSTAAIVIDPGSFYESRLGYVVDGPSPSFDLVYNSTIATPVLLSDTLLSDGGTSSYSTSDVAVSNENTGIGLGTSFDLRSTASAAILESTASFAYAHAYNEYLTYFHLTAPQTL